MHDCLCFTGLRPTDPFLGMPSRNPGPGPIFLYKDFRVFLQALIRDRRRANPHFSCRYTARRLGLRSPSTLLHVLNGTNRLTPRLREKLITFLGLAPRDAAALAISQKEFA